VRRGILATVAALALAAACATREEAPPLAAADAPAGAEDLSRRAAAFYGALRGRPLDVWVTYDDPNLRSYFASERDFSDWFASLANQVRASNLRYSRPDEVEIREVRFEGAETATVVVVFVGPHEQPLRLRAVEVERADVWRLSDGTWLLAPGRL
jgi:hypothetical protein